MASAAQPVPPAPAASWWQRIAPDAPAVLFSVKTYAAAIAAYWIALSVGMEHPSWAITTAYITSQPFAGGVVGKAIYRLIGTLLSGAMAVLLVPNLVNAPELLALALALWLGICTFLSGINRAPSTYVFLMSGYTVSIISYPVLDAPQTVFTTAAFRVQEIGIGILCAAFFHGAILPNTITARLLTRVREVVAAAERWTIAALGDETIAGTVAERRRLAVDLDELRTLSASLPFDTARLMPRVATVSALRDQLMQLLPLAATIEDRRRALAGEGGVPPPVEALLADVRTWLAAPDRPADDADRADALRARAAAIEPEPGRPPAWRDLLAMTLLARLGELIAAHRNCRLLAAQVSEPDLIFRRAAVPLVQRHRWRSMHVDIEGAARTGLGAVLSTLLACTFWIATAWNSGGNAVLFAGVATALFGSQDNPKAAIGVFLKGVVIGSLTGLFFAFAVLPRATDFVTMMAVVAPAFLIAGVGIARPTSGPRSLGFVIGLITAAGFDLRYDSDFASVVNGTIALVLGVLFATLVVGLTAPVDPQAATRRVIRAGWRDIAARANRREPTDIPGWVARMVDRIGLLTPRLERLDIDPGKPLLDTLTDMRTGVNVGQLRDLRSDAPATDDVLTPVLAGVARYFATLEPAAPQPPPDTLRHAIDGAIGGLGGAATFDGAVTPADRRRGLLALVGVRRNLFPAAAAPNLAVAS